MYRTSVNGDRCAIEMNTIIVIIIFLVVLVVVGVVVVVIIVKHAWSAGEKLKDPRLRYLLNIVCVVSVF